MEIKRIIKLAILLAMAFSLFVFNGGASGEITIFYQSLLFSVVFVVAIYYPASRSWIYKISLFLLVSGIANYMVVGVENLRVSNLLSGTAMGLLFILFISLVPNLVRTGRLRK